MAVFVSGPDVAEITVLGPNDGPTADSATGQHLQRSAPATAEGRPDLASPRSITGTSRDAGVDSDPPAEAPAPTAFDR